MTEFGVMHDRWLADFRQSETHVWCANPGCDNHADGVTVTVCSEYGQGWCEPEECWICNGTWLHEEPEEPDDDDE